MNVLNAELDSVERKQRVLDALLASGKISAAAYDQLNDEFTRLAEKMGALKEILEQEEEAGRFRLNDQIRILERILANLEFRYLSGEYNLEEWERRKAILTSGLNSIKAMKDSIKTPSGLCPPTSIESISEKESRLEDAAKSGLVMEKNIKIDIISPFKETLENKNETRDRSKTRERVRKKLTNSRPYSRSISSAETHCKNPWNGECKNTDIELSIYYNGEFLPICHKCWQEISEKNLEWSSF